jgi:hypothetical protein
MSSQNQLITAADLSIINNALRSISSDMHGVHSELGTINFKQEQLESEVLRLAEAFFEFVKADLKHKALQLAETRQGNLKQDLQIKYGYYAEVRRMATGILQGVDSGVLSDDTLRFTTEEVMIKAPGYWLAPALVAVAAWIRNDKSTCEKAVNESLKRDDYKSTLFFMLVMRRLSRNEASLKWLERYFIHQDPSDLDREFIIILEAVTTGVFPPASRNLMMDNVKKWLQLFSQGDEFIDQQKAQWVSFFDAMAPLDEGKYPLLGKFSSNAGNLIQSLREARAHQKLNGYFNEIFSSSSSFNKTVKVQLDEILSLLVSNFDDEELPLQEQVRLNQLIIQMEGDKDAAQAMMDSEKNIFDEKVDFLQLLTNACFNPELSGATKVTQALAVSISQPWIVEAHDTFTAKTRNDYPKEIELSIDKFNIFTVDGSDEVEMLAKQSSFYESIEQKELSELSFPVSSLIIGALLILASYWGFNFHIVIGTLFLGVGAVIFFQAINNHNKAKKQIVENVAARKQKSEEVLRGCIAEIVDYRKELYMEDANAEVLRQLLNGITSEDFSSRSLETARNVI